MELLFYIFIIFLAVGVPITGIILNRNNKPTATTQLDINIKGG